MKDKSLLLPRYTRRALRFGFSPVGEKDGKLAVRAYHFRPDGGKLVCAEGRSGVCAIPNGAELVRNSEGLLYAVNGLGELYRYNGGAFVSAGGVMNLRAIASFVLKDGEKRVYAVSDAGTYLLEDTPVYIADATGGRCAAVHYERLFTASGYRVHYSAPLEPENRIESAQGAGFIDLPSQGGDILDAVSYKEKLYLFRERGITQLRALGDNLNFKAVTMPYSCGKLAAESVANCGQSVLFFTESGLFSFNGGTCVMLTGYGAERVDLSAPVRAVSAGGKYFAAVTLLTGERGIFCADPARGAGHFIAHAAESLVGGGELYLSDNGTLSRLTKSGAPDVGKCYLDAGNTSLGLSDGDKFLDAVLPEGEGEFVVEAYGDNGSSGVAEGKAGARLGFSRPVRGRTFSFRITALTEDAALSEIVLSVREEDKYGY